MPVRAACPHCKTVYTLPDEHLGMTLRCRQCQQLFRAPKPPAAVTTAPAAAPAPKTPAPKAPQPKPPQAPPLATAVTTAPARVPPPPEDDDEIPVLEVFSEPKNAKKKTAHPTVDRPRGKKRSSVGLLLGCLGALVLFGGCGVVGVVFVARSVWKNADSTLTAALGGGEAAEEPAPVPVPAPIAIQAAPLQGDKTTLALPGTVRDVCVGGGGRYLILHLPQQRQLAVFDVNEAKVIKYLPVTEDHIFFAAGLDKLMVVLPDKNLVQRWSLTTFEREVTAPLPIQGKVFTAAMGSASDGPLVLGGPELRGAGGLPLRFLDVTTLKEIEVALQERQGVGMVGTHPQYPHVMRISADGRVIGMWNIGLSPSGLQTVVLNGTGVQAFSEHTSVGHVFPGPDGRTVFTGMGLYTAEVKKLGGAERGGFTLPAVHGNYYLSVANVPGVWPRGEGGKPSVAVQMAGDARPLVTLTDLDGLPAAGGEARTRDRDALSLDKRLFLVPLGKLIVVIPPTADKLHLQRFDLDEALEKAGIDYLFVTSQPPGRCKPGEKLSYQLAIKSKKGGLKYKVESGPPGMKVTPDGRVTWPVPADFADAEMDVILTISDAAGQEVFHTFKLKNASREPQARAPEPPPQVAAGPKEPPPQPRPTTRKEPAPPVEQPEAKQPPPPQPDPVAERPAPKKPAPGPLKGEPLVRVPANPLPIDPAPLQDAKTTVSLPGTVRDVCVGGGGRFLILHLLQQRQFAVFDASAAKVAKFIPVAEDNVLFAAGMDKLVIVFPDKNLVQRWSLTTFERDVTATLSVTGRIHSAAMGSASDGPLVLGGPELRGAGGLPLRFLDATTLKEIVPQAEGRGGGMVGTHPQYPHVMRISADGRVIGMWNIGLSPSGLETVVLNGSSTRAAYEHESVGSVIPGPDGRTVFTGAGLYTPELKKMPGEARGGLLLPAVHGNYYVSVTGVNAWPPDRNNSKPSVAVYMTGDARPLVTLSDLDGLASPAGGDPFDRNLPSLPLDKRLFLVPLAKLLVTIPATADKLHLQRFDLDEALEKADIDYLLVRSQPVSSAVKGLDYAYPLKVKAKKGGVKYKVESGPDGMKVSPEGRVSWPVPKDFAEAEVNIILTVSDAAGQEVFHTFKIGIKDKAEPAPPAAVEGKPPEGKPPKPKAPEKVVELKLAPAAEAMANLKPTPLEQDVEERKLPGTVNDVCVGGGGRFLILHLATEHKLGVFDAGEGKIVKYLPAAEDGIKFAAGMEKLIVYLPTGNILQRWSLATFEREVAVPCPVPGGVSALAMGSASPGPLVLARNATQNFGPTPALLLLDPQTFKESEYKLGAGAPGFGNDGYGARLAMSADGRVIVSPAERRTLVREGQTYKPYPGGFGMPGPDSRTVFTHGQLFTVEGKPLGQHVGGHGSMVWHVPALQGPYYVTLNEKRDGGNGRQRLDLGVHIVGDARPLATLPKLAALEGMVDWQSGQVPPFERHVFLISDAQLLVVIPIAKDRLVLHRLNLDEQLDKSGVDFLFVTSQPPTVAGKRKDYAYQLAVKSKKGGVKAKLDAGPAGMKLSPEGKLTWAVPKDFADADVSVVLTIGDSSGQEVFHTFHIAVKEPGDLPAKN